MVDEEQSNQFLTSPPDNVHLLSTHVQQFHLDTILKLKFQDFIRHNEPSRGILFHPHSDLLSTRNPRAGKVDELVRLSHGVPLVGIVAANCELQGKLVGLPHHFDALLQVRIARQQHPLFAVVQIL